MRNGTWTVLIKQEGGSIILSSSKEYNWTQYILLSDKLIKDDVIKIEDVDIERETFYRCALSRAYYGAFCTARKLCKSKLTKTGKDHGIVKEHFKNGSSKTEKKIGATLERLFDARCEADYEDIVENLGFKAQLFVKVALSIPGLVSKLTEEAS